jgi:hypothetical protein
MKGSVWKVFPPLRLSTTLIRPVIAWNSTPLKAFPVILSQQRETRTVPLLFKIRTGRRRTRRRLHKKRTKILTNQIAAEKRRAKQAIQENRLYEYIEGTTADEETKQKWFKQFFLVPKMMRVKQAQKDKAALTELEDLKKHLDDKSYEAEKTRLSKKLSRADWIKTL